MIDREHDLPITKQAQVLHISRGSVYYLPRPVSATDLEVMRRLDRLHPEFPFAGSRMLQALLAAEGCQVGRRHVKTLMKLSDNRSHLATDRRRRYKKLRSAARWLKGLTRIGRCTGAHKIDRQTQ